METAELAEKSSGFSLKGYLFRNRAGIEKKKEEAKKALAAETAAWGKSSARRSVVSGSLTSAAEL